MKVTITIEWYHSTPVDKLLANHHGSINSVDTLHVLLEPPRCVLSREDIADVLVIQTSVVEWDPYFWVLGCLYLPASRSMIDGVRHMGT